MNTFITRILASAVLLGAMQAAEAHVSFLINNPNLPYAKKSFVGTMNISHGCEDGTANHHDTTEVEVTIPAGVTGVRPMDTAFGTATIVEKDANGNATKLKWTKSANALAEDDHYYQVTWRGTLPDAALTSIQFNTVQRCSGGGGLVKDWGADSPTLNILPARSPGWNKYTAQADITALKTFFSDAYIVWYNGAAYSSNTVTDGLITNKLTTIPAGAEFWVKY